MKILIGYDGSASADAALEGLKCAGLPTDAKVLIATVGEVWIPPPGIELPDLAFTPRLAATTTALEQSDRRSKQTEEIASLALSRLQSDFPNWRLETHCQTGDPGDVLIEKANDWKADLVVVGSRNRSAIEQIFLGSVSKKVVAGANCSVRVARGTISDKKFAPQRIILGVDSRETARLIVRQIARREWTQGSVAMLVTAIPAAGKDGVSPVQQRIEAQEILQPTEAKLADSGLKVLTRVREGDPKSVLLAEAETLFADCIFVGSRNLEGTLNRILLGSVSLGMATDAPCSVEVVRVRPD